MNPLPNDHAVPRVRNPAITVFRTMLWLLPAGFMVFSLAGISQLNTGIFPRAMTIPIWLILGAVFTVGTGWFNAWLSGDARLKPGRVHSQTVKFFLFQLFIVPAIVVGSILVFFTILLP